MAVLHARHAEETALRRGGPGAGLHSKHHLLRCHLSTTRVHGSGKGHLTSSGGGPTFWPESWAAQQVAPGCSACSGSQDVWPRLGSLGTVTALPAGADLTASYMSAVGQ